MNRRTDGQGISNNEGKEQIKDTQVKNNQREETRN
jgi:hypothetical protein